MRTLETPARVSNLSAEEWAILSLELHKTDKYLHFINPDLRFSSTLHRLILEPLSSHYRTNYERWWGIWDSK